LSEPGSETLPGAPAIDAERVVAELRELDELTGGRESGGARRVAWGPVWRQAREWLTGKLAEIGVEPEIDEAGNLWATLPGSEPGPALGLGSHIDSVPAGGWLDGALGVVGALGVLRAWAGTGAPPPRGLTLIDFADEEGSRFGRSLLGSSAVAGTLDGAAIEGLADADGNPIAEVLAENGVELARAGEAEARLASINAYLELHIEQGPVLEGEGLPCSAVSGCAGVERLVLVFEGRASHAGTTPMDARRDAGLAAASTALAIEQIARDAGGVGTTGALGLDPGIVTAVAGRAELSVDLRHGDAEALAAMLGAVRDVAGKVAASRGCGLEERHVWKIEPIPFDSDLVAIAALYCARHGGRERPIRSGALHDAAEIARRIPVAMIFSSSTEGVSHNSLEDTPTEHLRAAIEAFGDLAAVALIR
jgi:hydantoinase/carbamoylase family amidase